MDRLHSSAPGFAPDLARANAATDDFREAERNPSTPPPPLPDSCVACALQRKSCSACNGAVASQLRKLSPSRSCQAHWATPSTARTAKRSTTRAPPPSSNRSRGRLPTSRAAGLLETQARLKREPMGELRAKVTFELATTGSCRQLTSFERGQPPVGRHNQLRVVGEGGRSMRHADAKLALEGGRAADDGGDRARRGRAPRRRQMVPAVR